MVSMRTVTNIIRDPLLAMMQVCDTQGLYTIHAVCPSKSTVTVCKETEQCCLHLLLKPGYPGTTQRYPDFQGVSIFVVQFMCILKNNL